MPVASQRGAALSRYNCASRFVCHQQATHLASQSVQHHHGVAASPAAGPPSRSPRAQVQPAGQPPSPPPFTAAHFIPTTVRLFFQHLTAARFTVAMPYIHVICCRSPHVQKGCPGDHHPCPAQARWEDIGRKQRIQLLPSSLKSMHGTCLKTSWKKLERRQWEMGSSGSRQEFLTGRLLAIGPAYLPQRKAQSSTQKPSIAPERKRHFRH